MAAIGMSSFASDIIRLPNFPIAGANPVTLLTIARHRPHMEEVAK
jgi:hypothetical protein